MIILHWPDKSLSPNARVHWSVKAKAVKAARQAAGWATKESKIKIDWDGAIYLHITFHTPTNRNHDFDNCLARMKGSLDGIADALGVNDHRFRISMEFGDVVKGGKVIVRIKEKE